MILGISFGPKEKNGKRLKILKCWQLSFNAFYRYFLVFFRKKISLNSFHYKEKG